MPYFLCGYKPHQDAFESAHFGQPGWTTCSVHVRG
jgi:hypothetical protein